MIPHRMLSNESCGNGLKGRVTACRKRLRVNRVAHRGQAINESEGLYHETGSVSQLQEIAPANPPGCPNMSFSAGINYSSSISERESGIKGTLLVSEQEVGIT